MPQQVARIDHVDRSLLADGTSDQVAATAGRLVEQAQALILSDYDIAALTTEVISSVLPAARRAGTLVVVDAHDQFRRFQGIHTATPNQPEAEAEVGFSLDGDDALHRGAAALVERMD